MNDSFIFECECGFKIPMKPDEFPLNCKCGKVSFNQPKSEPIELSTRINLDKIKYEESPTGLIGLNDVTACITTYKRVGCLERLLKSIKEYYPDLKIDVIDTEGNLSWGRNQLVQRCKTLYCLILEDDFEFTKYTDIKILLTILQQDDTLGLIGGEISNDDSIKRFQGKNMNLFRGVMEYTICHYLDWKLTDNIRYRYCDYISNFFLSSLDCLISNPWDEDLALMEHIPWFWTLKEKGQYKVGYTDSMSINHHKDRSDLAYNEIRLNIKPYKEIIEKKYGIKKGGMLKHISESSCVRSSHMTESIIYGLWIGPILPRLQNLCIKSWLSKGYDYKLFVYEDVQNVPLDVDILDGKEFIKQIYLYQDKSHLNNPALHANYFRYKWLYEKGGTWVDVDTACIYKLSDHSIIFSSEPVRSEPFWHPNVAVTRVPPKHKVMEHCVHHTEKQLNEGCFDRGFFGPKLIKYCLKQNKMFNIDYVSIPEVFCPYPWWMTEDIYRSHSLPVPIQSSCIHLWNNSCENKGINVSEHFDSLSMYERLWKYLEIE